jgi:hypothetical protein
VITWKRSQTQDERHPNKKLHFYVTFEVTFKRARTESIVTAAGRRRKTGLGGGKPNKIKEQSKRLKSRRLMFKCNGSLGALARADLLRKRVRIIYYFRSFGRVGFEWLARGTSRYGGRGD